MCTPRYISSCFGKQSVHNLASEPGLGPWSDDLWDRQNIRTLETVFHHVLSRPLRFRYGHSGIQFKAKILEPYSSMHIEPYRTIQAYSSILESNSQRITSDNYDEHPFISLNTCLCNFFSQNSPCLIWYMLQTAFQEQGLTESKGLYEGCIWKKTQCGGESENKIDG